MDLNKSLAPNDDTQAMAALMLLPMSLVVALFFALALIPEQQDPSSPRLDTRLLMRIYWLMWAYFWVVATILAYVF